MSKKACDKMGKKRIKRKLNVGKIFLTLCLIILLILVVIFLSTNNQKPKPIIIENKQKKQTEETYKVSVIAAGDNLIHSSIYKDAHHDDTYNFKPMYELIKPIVSNFDIAYYNQETILGGTALGLSDYPAFNSPQEVGDAMIDAGFNLVSLATNHTMDAGEKAIISSREYWNSKQNVLAVGSYSSQEEKNEIHILKKNNITYTMLNYTYGTNGINVPPDKQYLVNVWPTKNIPNMSDDEEYQKYKQQVKSDVDAVRDKVDVLIVAMHWGEEYKELPNNYQKDMAKYLESIGVDVIIGTHPHVIEPIEWINNTLVIYSLGNLISAQYQDDNYSKTVGLMTSFDIEKKITDNNKQIKITNVNTELIYTYYKDWRNFKVVPFSNKNIENYLPEYKQVYKIYRDIIKKYDSTINVNPFYEE